MTESQIDAYDVADVELVGAALVKFATMAAEQFPGAAALATSIASPLIMEAKRHKDAMKKAAEKGAEVPCETKGFMQ